MLCLAVLLVLLIRRRRAGGALGGLVDAVGVDRVSDVLIADGMGGEIHIEHLLLTGHGLAVSSTGYASTGECADPRLGYGCREPEQHGEVGNQMRWGISEGG